MACRIVLADDCPVIRRTVRTILEREGHDVIAEAGDGQEGVRLAAALSPDLVILDLSMPVLGGLAAAREIHRLNPKTGLILLTSEVTRELIMPALQSGITGIVEKTDAVDDLPRAVSEVRQGGRFLSLKPSRLLLDALLTDSPSA